jgi:hypothetical protein
VTRSRILPACCFRVRTGVKAGGGDIVLFATSAVPATDADHHERGIELAGRLSALTLASPGSSTCASSPTPCLAGRRVAATAGIVVVSSSFGRAAGPYPRSPACPGAVKRRFIPCRNSNTDPTGQDHYGQQERARSTNKVLMAHGGLGKFSPERLAGSCLKRYDLFISPTNSLQLRLTQCVETLNVTTTMMDFVAGSSDDEIGRASPSCSCCRGCFRPLLLCLSLLPVSPSGGGIVPSFQCRRVLIGGTTMCDNDPSFSPQYSERG